MVFRRSVGRIDEIFPQSCKDVGLDGKDEERKDTFDLASA